MRRAFTLIELLCAIAIIALLAALLLPVISRGYGQVRRAGCVNNLKNIGAAFHIWAHEHNDLFPMQVSTNLGGTREFAEATVLNPDVSLTFRHFQVLSNELVVAKLLRCPADQFRAPADDFSTLRGSNVSYWININARFGDTESPIAGDRNVRTSGRVAWTFVQFSTADVLEFTGELHGSRGNVLFGDAHVDALAGDELRPRFASSNNSSIATLSLPREDVTAVPDSSAGQTQSQNSSTPGSDDSTKNAAPTARPNDSAAQSNANVLASPTQRPAAARRNHADEVPILITKLDGTMVTSTAPHRVTNSNIASAQWREPIARTNPLLEFIEWLGRTATKHTYALLFLLLLALIAFEIARRRAERRRRKHSD
jgi:prepilin-type N-terminal cleavage/methylation domain-containing protein/prepilin-type processing-associated H-X9-DG protein